MPIQRQKTTTIAKVCLGTSLCFFFGFQGKADPMPFSQVPTEIRQIIAKHAVWQSITVLGASDSEGASSMSTLQISQKWTRTQRGLAERTRLSVDVDCVEILGAAPDLSKAFQWKSSEIDFQKDVEPHVFFFDPERALMRCQGKDSGKATFRKIDGNRFEISFESLHLRTLFFPEIASAPFVSDFSGPQTHVWRAPLGLSEEIYSRLYQLRVENTNYLHHDLNEIKYVYMDHSFPKEFTSVLRGVLKKWNSALGREFFQLRDEPIHSNEADCYTSNRICVRWKGSRSLAWSKLACFASTSFDPETGKIIGGVLQCSNGADPIRETPLSVIQEYRSYSTNIDWVAKVYLRWKEFSEYQHPEPEKLLTFFLLHEFGHFNGLGHNLMGSVTNDQNKVSKSIMDYPPFPLLARSQNIEIFDQEVIDLVYRRVPVSREFQYCSDAQSEKFLSKVMGVKKQPSCNKNDYGEPVFWFMALAKNGNDGVWTQDPSSLETVFSSLAEFLKNDLSVSPFQRATAKNYFCSSQFSSEVFKKLAELIGYSIDCNQVERK